MYGHLQGFLSVLDILGEGAGRQAELIGGRGQAPAQQLLPSVAPARSKLPLTQHQISRLFGASQKSRVSIEH